MSNFCLGLKDSGERCGIQIGKKKEYCHHHEKQKYKSESCMVMNSDGTYCGHSVNSEDKCIFHTTARLCFNHDKEQQCKNMIVIGEFCPICNHNRPSVETLIKDSAKRMAEMIYSQGPVVRRRAQPKQVFMFSKEPLVIPEILVRPSFDDETTCPICIENFEDGKKSSVKKLSCGHKFHFDCLSGLTAFTCPICRAEIRKGQIPNRIYDSILKNIEKAEAQQEEYNFQLARRIQEDLGHHEVDHNLPEDNDLEEFPEWIDEVVVLNMAYGLDNNNQ